MKRSKEITAKEKIIVRRWLDMAKSATTLRRVLCLWLRINGYKAEEIHEMIGWSVGQVQKIQSTFMRHGESIFMTPGKGGKRNQYLSGVSGETAFINTLRDKKTGMIFLKIPEIKRKFELAARKPENSVAASTIYRFLKRHGYKSYQLNDGQRVFSN
jgi:transposase